MIVLTSLTISFVLKLLSLSFGLRLKLLDQPAVSRGQFLSQSTLCPIITCCPTSNEPAANLFCDVELAAAKSPRPDDGVAWPAIAWSFRLEQPEHSLRAVSRPHSNDSSFDFAQCLRRTHTKILPSLPDFSAPTRLQAAGDATGLVRRGATRSQPRTGWP